MSKIDEAMDLLSQVGMPTEQRNERSALVLLALANLSKDEKWSTATPVLIGVTPIMDWIATNYDRKYKPNTRETIRRQTLHQFCDAGLTRYNPDQPDRSPNSPKAVYRLTDSALALIKSYGTRTWPRQLKTYLANNPSLVEQYAKERERVRVPVRDASGRDLTLTPGAHSDLIKQIIEVFAAHYLPGAILLYVGDTENKWLTYDPEFLKSIGVVVDQHGKMPDVVLYDSQREWLVLVEAVTSHGPVDGKRHNELSNLFDGCTAGLVYVTAFPDRKTMAGYVSQIAWETEVWVASDPTHLIHFNGERFLGPYK